MVFLLMISPALMDSASQWIINVVKWILCFLAAHVPSAREPRSMQSGKFRISHSERPSERWTKIENSPGK